jgi:DNA-binding CsgD family transcriptional regulator
MPTGHNQRFRATKRRHEVAELYLQGWSQLAIAEKLGVTQSTVSHDLEKVQAEWRASGIRNFDLIREVELRKLDRIEREGWAAWERSQKPTQSAVVTDQGGGSGQRTRKSLKNQIGDPRFLELVNKCIAQRRTLLGLDAPLQVADVTPTPLETTAERQARLKQILRTIMVEPERRGLPSPDQEA